MPDRSDSRECFLERVRTAVVAHADGQKPAPVAEATEVGRSVPVGSLTEDFVANATRAGIQVRPVPAHSDVVVAVAEILRGHSIQCADIWSDGSLDRYGLETLTEHAGIVLRPCDHDGPDEVRKSAAFRMECGITAVDYAISETGSLVLTSGPGRPRSVSLLGDLHIAIIEKAALVPDLYDLPSRLANDFPDHLPSNVIIITGPSKTADIELQIVVGVHGPRCVYAILVEGE